MISMLKAILSSPRKSELMRVNASQQVNLGRLRTDQARAVRSLRYKDKQIQALEEMHKELSAKIKALEARASS